MRAPPAVPVPKQPAPEVGRLPGSHAVRETLRALLEFRRGGDLLELAALGHADFPAFFGHDDHHRVGQARGSFPREAGRAKDRRGSSWNTTIAAIAAKARPAWNMAASKRNL